MASNKYLKVANKNKNDEFYTQLADIDKGTFSLQRPF